MTSEARRKILWASVALAVAAAGLWLISSRSAARAEVDRLESKLEIARGDAGAEIEALEAEVENLDGQLSDLRTEFEDLTATRDLELAELEELRIALESAVEENATLSAALEVIGEREIVLMPDLTGSGLELAEEFAELHDLVLKSELASPGNLIARPGAIIEQLPLPETPVIPGTVVWVSVFSP